MLKMQIYMINKSYKASEEARKIQGIYPTYAKKVCPNLTLNREGIMLKAFKVSQAIVYSIKCVLS